jgi:hypothetical protein
MKIKNNKFRDITITLFWYGNNVLNFIFHRHKIINSVYTEYQNHLSFDLNGTKVKVDPENVKLINNT